MRIRDWSSDVCSSDLAIDSFIDDDTSPGQRKSKFLLAGLAGLGRVSAGTRADLAERLNLDLDQPTRWPRMITRATEVDNASRLALLAGQIGRTAVMESVGRSLVNSGGAVLIKK